MSKPNSVFIDGVEYVRLDPLPTIGLSQTVKQVMELKVYITQEVFEYLNTLPSNTFTASNGFKLKNIGRDHSRLDAKQFDLNEETFSNRQKELFSFFKDHSRNPTEMTKEIGDSIVLALKELAAVAPKKKPKIDTDASDFPKNLEKY